MLFFCSYNIVCVVRAPSSVSFGSCDVVRARRAGAGGARGGRRASASGQGARGRALQWVFGYSLGARGRSIAQP